MEFNLESFRTDKLKMTQAEFAALLDVRQDTISRIENKLKDNNNDPSQIPLNILIAIAEKTGQTLDQLLSYKKPGIEALSVDPTWAKVDYMKRTVVDYIENFSDLYTDANSTNYAEGIKSLHSVVKSTIRKPKIVFVGRSDSGKSTMINALIGKEKMPTNWTPTTAIIVYVKHVEDRPAYIEEELWLFKRGDGVGWDDTMLEDECYCREWKIAGGSAEMLASYGTQKGENYNSDEVGSAVLFIDSPLLKNVDLLDVPGFTGGIQSDNEMARGAKNLADVLVYLSQANGFMSHEDTVFLKDAIRSVGCPERKDDGKFGALSNIFVVATQAHIINNGNEVKVKEILTSGAERFWNCLTDKFWKDRTSVSGLEYTKEDLQDRFYSYTTDIPALREKFESDLRALVEDLPADVQEKATIAIKSKASDQRAFVEAQLYQYTALLNEREEVAGQVRALEENEPQRKARMEEKRKEINSTISKCNTLSRRSFQEHYSSILDVEHIIETIDSRGYRSKKEDMQALASFISSELEDSLKDTLERESKGLSAKIDEFIASFEANCRFEAGSAPRMNMNGFNARRAFASGLAGAATFGGLALWASSVGNLGGYILVAKGVSLLSGLGISISGGAATATSAVAAIGGPVVLGVALAVVAALGVFAAFSGGWKKKVAKKLKDAFAEQGALSKYNENIDKYWRDTQSAFNAAADKMEIEWNRYLNDMRALLNNYDVELLATCIEKGKAVKHFFENIPL